MTGIELCPNQNNNKNETKLLVTGCEGDVAVTSVTPLIARVDSADLAI